MEKEIFCPLPCSTAGLAAIGHPICIINMPHMMVIIHHNCRLYCVPVFIAIIAFCGWIVFRLLTLVMCNFYLRRFLNPLQLLVFDSETADEPEHVSHTKTHALRKNLAQLVRRTAQSQLREIRISADYLVELFPAPT